MYKKLIYLAAPISLIALPVHAEEQAAVKMAMEAVANELEQASFNMHRKAIEIQGICKHCNPN